jgi:hypothetical protein
MNSNEDNKNEALSETALKNIEITSNYISYFVSSFRIILLILLIILMILSCYVLMSSRILSYSIFLILGYLYIVLAYYFQTILAKASISLKLFTENKGSNNLEEAYNAFKQYWKYSVFLFIILAVWTIIAFFSFVVFLGDQLDIPTSEEILTPPSEVSPTPPSEVSPTPPSEELHPPSSN